MVMAAECPDCVPPSEAKQMKRVGTIEPKTEVTPVYDAIMAGRSNEAKLFDANQKLRAALAECLEYFENQYDVEDGQDGPLPNKEMRLGQMIQEVLDRPA